MVSSLQIEDKGKLVPRPNPCVVRKQNALVLTTAVYCKEHFKACGELHQLHLQRRSSNSGESQIQFTKYKTRNMLRQVKNCVLLPWKLPLFRMRLQGSIKVLRLSVVILTVAALIMMTIITTLFTGIKSSSLSKCECPSSSDSGKRSQPTMAPTLYRDCKSWKTFSQHKTTLITRTVCARHYSLLILVSSAPANFERRNLIRQTWGTDNSTAPQWKTYFLLGQTTNQTHSDLLQTENNNFGDIIRADYHEHYWNQSLKIRMAFEWAARYCNFSFLLKADDDVLVNTRRLIDVLQLESTPKKGLYMGKLHSHPVAQRDGKWRVSYEEYSGAYYPDFCSGAGFVMTYDVIECVVPLFDVIKPYRLDDVYVGMLANKLGVKAVDHSGFVMPFHDYDHCNFVPNTLVQHRATGACLIKLLKMHNNA